MTQDASSTTADPGVVVGDDGLARPAWAAAAPLLRDYYDTEWGMPVTDERGVYERVSLEGFQAGLSWATILRKRPAFRAAFDNFLSLLIELDLRTGFLDCFVHAGGHKQARSAELKRNILAVLIANATNLGLTKMAEACGVPYDVLAWTQEWYVREERLREANTVIVNHHHSLEPAKVFGGGTMSSSDGQRFPVRGKSLTARAMNVFFADQGLSAW